MQIGIPAETLAGETRVAATPETVKKFAALGCEVIVQAGAGLASSATDAAYEAAGAKVVATAAETLANADFVLKVAAPTADEAALIKQGATVFAAFAPHQNPHFDAYAAKGLVVGHGGLVVHDDSANLAKLARYAMEFCAIESCGKCTPCRIGSTRGEELLAQIIVARSEGPQPGRIELLKSLCESTPPESPETCY